MRSLFFFLAIFLAVATTANLRAATTRYPVETALTIQDHDTHQPLTLPAKKGYSYEVSEQLTDIAVLRVFNAEGQALDGFYEVTAEELHQMLQREINAGLKATSVQPEKQKCASCQVMEAGKDKPVPDRRPALERPTPAPHAPAKPTAPAPSAEKKEPLCELYGKFRAQGVPSVPLKQALLFYAKQQKEKAGPRKITKPLIAIADYSQNSRSKRFYLLDLVSGKIAREKVSHGGGMASAGYPGDPRHQGMLKKCGSRGGDGLQRPGFFKFGDYYYSDHGRGNNWPLLAKGKNGVKLIGLSPKVNWLAENDGVVAHEAKYNFDGSKMPMGRTNACLGFVPGHGKPLLAKLNGGAMLYSYAPQCVSEMKAVYAQVPEWKNFCGEEKEAEVAVDPNPKAEKIPLPRPRPASLDAPRPVLPAVPLPKSRPKPAH